MATLQSAINNVGYNPNPYISDVIEDIQSQLDKQNKIIVDILVAIKDSHPDLVVKYLDEIAKVKDEN